MLSIYKATNDISGRIYIGATSQPIATRWKQHLKEAASDRQERKHALHRAIAKHGRDAFSVEHIACAVDRDNLMQLEMQIIAQEDATNSERGYNETIGGDRGGPPLVAGSPAAIKSGLARRGKCYRTPEQRAEAGRKVAAGKAGQALPRHTTEAAIKANKGKMHSADRRERAAAGLRAHLAANPRTPEHCARISAGKRGGKLSPDHVERVRAANIGRVKSPAECQKLRQARLNDSLLTKAKRYAKTWVPKYAPLYVNATPTYVPDAVACILAHY